MLFLFYKSSTIVFIIFNLSEIKVVLILVNTHFVFLSIEISIFFNLGHLGQHVKQNQVTVSTFLIHLPENMFFINHISPTYHVTIESSCEEKDGEASSCVSRAFSSVQHLQTEISSYSFFRQEGSLL